MTGFDGASPELIYHTRAAITRYVDFLQAEISLAQSILIENADLGTPTNDSARHLENLVLKLDEAQTAFARLPFSIKPNPEFL